jgi:hypothetical protein
MELDEKERKFGEEIDSIMNRYDISHYIILALPKTEDIKNAMAVYGMQGNPYDLIEIFSSAIRRDKTLGKIAGHALIDYVFETQFAADEKG